MLSNLTRTLWHENVLEDKFELKVEAKAPIINTAYYVHTAQLLARYKWSKAFVATNYHPQTTGVFLLAGPYVWYWFIQLASLFLNIYPESWQKQFVLNGACNL